MLSVVHLCIICEYLCSSFWFKTHLFCFGTRKTPWTLNLEHVLPNSGTQSLLDGGDVMMF